MQPHHGALRARGCPLEPARACQSPLVVHSLPARCPLLARACRLLIARCQPSPPPANCPLPACRPLLARARRLLIARCPACRLLIARCPLVVRFSPESARSRSSFTRCPLVVRFSLEPAARTLLASRRIQPHPAASSRIQPYPLASAASAAFTPPYSLPLSALWLQLANWPPHLPSSPSTHPHSTHSHSTKNPCRIGSDRGSLHGLE